MNKNILLFGYETDGGTNSIFWKDPFYFSRVSGQGGKELDERYGEWINNKRAFRQEEIVEGKWEKIGDHGYSFYVQFYPDGTLIESDRKNPQNCWEGKWTLDGGVLQMKVNNYELDIYGNKVGNIHSGIENDNHGRYTYFKVIHQIG